MNGQRCLSAISRLPLVHYEYYQQRPQNLIKKKNTPEILKAEIKLDSAKNKKKLFKLFL